MTNRELAEALREISGKNSVSGYKRGVCAEAADALANSETHIEALQAEIENLRKQVEIVQAERDAVHKHAMKLMMEKAPQWVSVKERMPERWRDPDTSELVNYLVYSPDFGIDIGNYHAETKHWLVIGLPVHVTHWMPLPSTEGVE